jgi:phosphopantothenoylcysteine decarboxylase/phosphopantothenate--cysteine ligase
VGFAAETDHLEANATKKLREKNCDVIVANDARIGMETDENELLILFRDGETKNISRAPKSFLARELVKIFSNSQQKRLTKKM